MYKRQGFKWMIETTDRQTVGETIGISIDPFEIQVMRKSIYSGTFGDYSSFSDEMDTISDAKACLLYTSHIYCIC